MTKFLSLIVVLLFSFNANDVIDTSDSLVVQISQEERELYELIMEYRDLKGLERIPLSSSLTFVAQTHCKDLVENKPDKNQRCNAHSWSSEGNWTPCCYTADHRQAECMWFKPRELTSYEGVGYEIAVGVIDDSNPDYRISPEEALKSWQGSFSHNEVVINKGTWKNKEWKAIGVGIYKGVSTVWFGHEIDEAGSPVLSRD